MRVGIACVNTSTTCAPGGTLHHAWTAIYRSIVTIDDPTPPTASGASGSLFAGGYLRGNASATLGSAADGSGIKAVQVRVDGSRVVGETALACDYTRSRPCSDVASPTTVPVVTSNIGDGTHVAQVGAVDAGGNFTPASTQTITVDNEAPAPPTPTSPVFATTAGARATISWTEPPGQVSPVTHAHITVCKATVCRTSTQPAGLGSGQATVALPDGPGAYAVSVSLSDAAGNHDPYRAAHWSITLAGSLATVIPTPDDPDTHDADERRPASRGADRGQGPPHHPGPRDDGPEHARPCPSHAQGPGRRPRPHDHEAGDGHEPPLHRHAQAPVTPLADGDADRPPRHHDDHEDDSQPLSD